MTGYGMILIVDHGNGYMSLYAHNDTLLKDAGARGSRGDAVAKVGNSGGQGVTALYFELRRGGQPVNPDSWLQRRGIRRGRVTGGFNGNLAVLRA
ncbi:hypothetical protein G6F32_015726 [Rhizopus arrhizus]|nr:hypothetical protein G6F32_015726 [Rhizopus arrhizus]